MIVDDTTANIEILSEVLGAGYEIFFATNGADAIDIARAEVPDIVLLDIMMPAMDGYEVCRRLKADKLTSAIPVIFITAMTDEADEARGLEIGAIDYITKPISPSIVRMRVRNHLELKRHRDFLESLSQIDGLTGIANRRRFNDYLDQEWRRAIRASIPLALIMMDIDLFKDYNDNYGHPAGDECLRKVAVALSDTLNRPADLVARFGGEEFVCVLPETDLAGATLVAGRLQEAIASANISHEHSSVSVSVTMSFGVVSTVPSQETSPDWLVEQADRFLYNAKHKGRNRIEGGHVCNA